MCNHSLQQLLRLARLLTLGGSSQHVKKLFRPLQGLRGSLGADSLNINELRAVLRLLRYARSATDADLARALARGRSQVCVPAADSRLVPAAECVHVLTAPRRLLRR